MYLFDKDKNDKDNIFYYLVKRNIITEEYKNSFRLELKPEIMYRKDRLYSSKLIYSKLIYSYVYDGIRRYKELYYTRTPPLGAFYDDVYIDIPINVELNRLKVLLRKILNPREINLDKLHKDILSLKKEIYVESRYKSYIYYGISLLNVNYVENDDNPSDIDDEDYDKEEDNNNSESSNILVVLLNGFYRL